MIEALSYEYDLLTDVSWPRLLLVAASLVAAYWAERRRWWLMLTAAWFISQGAEAVSLSLRTPLNVTIWWLIFGAAPYIVVRPELRRMVVSAPGQATMLLPRLLAWLQARREPLADGALRNREALKLLRAEGWRPGYVQLGVEDDNGRTHLVWAPPQRLPIGMRMHGWLAFLPTLALGGMVLWLFFQLPNWARPVAEVGIGIGVLGRLGLLPNPLHWIGL